MSGTHLKKPYSVSGMSACAKLLQSCLTLQLCGLRPARLLCQWDSPGKNTGEGCHALLWGNFPTQRWNSHLLCLLHWQEDSLPLAPPTNILPKKIQANFLANLILFVSGAQIKLAHWVCNIIERTEFHILKPWTVVCRSPCFYASVAGFLDFFSPQGAVSACLLVCLAHCLALSCQYMFGE